MAYARKLGQQAAGPAGGAGLIATGGAQTAGSAGGGAPAAGGGYTNLQDYLRLNQGGARAMQDRVAGYVGTEGKGATDALAQAQSDFTGQMNAGMGTNLGPPPMSGASPNAGGVWVHGAPPPDAPPTPEQLAALKQQAGQTYTGPSGLGDVADMDALTTQTHKAADDAQMASTFGGLAGSAGAPGLIGQIYGGHASQGGSNLDAFLAGAGGGLGGLSAQYKGLGDTLDAARAASQTQAGAAANETRRRADVAAGLYTQGQRAADAAHRRDVTNPAQVPGAADAPVNPREPKPKPGPKPVTFMPPAPSPRPIWKF